MVKSSAFIVITALIALSQWACNDMGKAKIEDVQRIVIRVDPSKQRFYSLMDPSPLLIEGTFGKLDAGGVWDFTQFPIIVSERGIDKEVPESVVFSARSPEGEVVPEASPSDAKHLVDTDTVYIWPMGLRSETNAQGVSVRCEYFYVGTAKGLISQSYSEGLSLFSEIDQLTKHEP